MDAKLALVVIFILFALQDMVQAEFLYNRVFPKQKDLKALGLKCIPGRTVMKMIEKPVEVLEEAENDDSEEDDNTLRSHMRFTTEDESCQICVCSVEAKDEYCSKRPAMNVNECMRMAVLMSQAQKDEPFDHQRTLAYMIRRDYIWHDDEIPHAKNARCKRSWSYYSNSINANDTDVEVGSLESLLDYDNKSICFYCVCTPDGMTAGCLPRSNWYCQFYRDARDPDSARDRYRIMFQQDRPTYFRQLSWRLRRTMDNGMFDLIENGGDSLCCSHSDGHRRQIHHQVRNKIRLLRNRVNKENLLRGPNGGDYADFVVNND